MSDSEPASDSTPVQPSEKPHEVPQHPSHWAKKVFTDGAPPWDYYGPPLVARSNSSSEPNPDANKRENAWYKTEHDLFVNIGRIKDAFGHISVSLRCRFNPKTRELLLGTNRLIIKPSNSEKQCDPPEVDCILKNKFTFVTINYKSIEGSFFFSKDEVLAYFVAQSVFAWLMHLHKKGIFD